MHSWLVTVLFLASTAYSSGGARVPITSYICTQPNRPGFRDLSQCSVSSGLRTCETKEGGSPTLLDGDTVGANGWYGWNENINPFVVLDIPQGWWVGSVVMTFLTRIPALSISVRTSERLFSNTDRTMFSNVSEEGAPVVVNFTTLACGRYLRINMTEDDYFFLGEIEVFGTNDPICTPPPSPGGNPVSPTTSGPGLTSSQSPSTHPNGGPIGPTTSVGSSNHSVTPTYTSDNSNTSGIPLNHDPVSPSVVPVGPPSYVLPAATSVVAVLLLVVVLIAIFAVVICIITRRHNTRKSFQMQHLSILYRSTQRRKSSDVTFKDDHLFAVSQSAELSIHAASGTADEKNNDSDIRDAPRNYAALGPSESNNNVVQGAVEEPVAEGNVSRPASQASIRSNEVPSKLTHGKVTWVHPSMLDHPYDSCNKEIAMAAIGGGGHYETPPHWQPAEETYDLPPDCRAVGKHSTGEVGKFPLVSGETVMGGVLGLLQECQDELGGWHQIGDLPGDNTYDLPPDCKLPNKGATTDGRHKVLKDAKATTNSQIDKAHRLPPQASSSTLPTVDNTYEDRIAKVPKMRREPDPSSPTYANVDPPSSSPMLTAVQPPKRISPCKPSDSAQSVSIPQEDHIYSEVDKSHKKPASSARSPPVGLTHSMDATHVCSEIDGSRKVDRKSTEMHALDGDFWGGSENTEGDAMAQPQSITSSTTAKGAVPTQEVAMGDVYAQVDYSKKKKSKKGKKK